MKYSIVLLLLCAFGSCVDDPGDPVVPLPDRTAYQYLSDRLEYSNFVDAVDKAGLQSLLDGSEVVTVLVPTNRAFREANFILSEKTENEVAALVQNHLIADSLKFLVNVGEVKLISSRQNEPLILRVLPGFEQVVDSNPLVLEDSSRNINSFIYPVTGLLEPPVRTIATTLVDFAIYNVLDSLLSEAPAIQALLEDRLNAYTFFAPIDSSITQVENLDAEQFFRQHLVQGTYFDFQLDDQPLVNLAGDTLAIDGSDLNAKIGFTFDGQVRFRDVPIYNNKTTNGVIHTLAKPLLFISEDTASAI